MPASYLALLEDISATALVVVLSVPTFREQRHPESCAKVWFCRYSLSIDSRALIWDAKTRFVVPPAISSRLVSNVGCDSPSNPPHLPDQTHKTACTGGLTSSSLPCCAVRPAQRIHAGLGGTEAAPGAVLGL